VDKGASDDFSPNPNPLPISPKILGRLKEWQRERTYLDEIAKQWKTTKPKTTLELHTGPMFSASTVVQSNRPIERTLSQWRKLSAVEMEAYAVHRAATDTVHPAPVFICAKSICDFAKGKSDDWQPYAAFTSARFIHRFICTEWSNIV
jgi:nucleoside phosphorylase